MSQLTVLSPHGGTAVEARSLARRAASLRGRRIGVLDNSKPNAGVLLGRIAELLVERAGAASVVVWRKPGSARPAAVIDEIVAGADVVLTGSAD